MRDNYKEEHFHLDKKKKTKLYCVMSYIYILWIVGFLSDSKNPQVRFHVNQGIVFSIFFFSSLFAIKIISAVLYFIAPILTIFTAFLQLVWMVVSFTYITIGVRNALKGIDEPLPFIGDLFIVLKG